MSPGIVGQSDIGRDIFRSTRAGDMVFKEKTRKNEKFYVKGTKITFFQIRCPEGGRRNGENMKNMTPT